MVSAFRALEKPTQSVVAAVALLVVAVVASIAVILGASEAGAQGMTLDICPSDYGGFPEDAPALTCGCSAEAVKQGSVYGANPYYWQSAPCRAALHAGAIGVQGGQVIIEPSKQSFFPAVARNGVEARSYGDGMGFRVAAVPGSMPATPTLGPKIDEAGKPVQAPIAETLHATGRVQLYINFATGKDKPLPSSAAGAADDIAGRSGAPRRADRPHR